MAPAQNNKTVVLSAGNSGLNQSNLASASERQRANAGARKLARRHVRHFLADFGALEERFPGAYPRVITRGEGAYLYDDEDRRLLDAGNHLGAGMVGHGREEIGRRMAEQVGRLEFAALDSGVSHDKVIELAGRLVRLVPLEDPVFSFTSSGSEANDLAFKLARAYHRRRGEPGRVKILSRDGSYHGSTLAGMSATGAPAFKFDFGPPVPGFVQGPQPSPGRCGYCDRTEGCTLACADGLREIVERDGPETIAAIVAEPVAILQAVKVPHARYWDRVQAICGEHGILLISDEVVTGFGRTGRLFGCQHWGIRPDIMTVAKGLTSGYAPMGATIVSRRVEDAFADGALMHLNTYAGHPVTCEAALATLDILQRERLPENAASLEPVLAAGLAVVGDLTGRLLRASVIGLLGSVEIDVSDQPDPANVLADVRHEMYERGVIARAALADGIMTIVFYPTLVVTGEDVASGTTILADVVADRLDRGPRPPVAGRV
jgi:adenosylmethionine-8-amino-7-oxononanoate aminotransferase